MRRMSTLLVLVVVMCLGLPAVDAVAAAKIQVTKQVLGGPFPSGSNVDFEIVVTNTGTVPFVAVEVTDAAAPACYRFLTDFDGSPTLAPGAEVRYTCTKFNVSGEFSNLAVATGFTRDASGCLVKTVRDKSPSVAVDVASPGITIVKRALDGTDLQTVFPGQDAHFEIIVTNRGEVALESVRVTDSKAPDCERDLPPLAPGASLSYTCVVPGVTQGFRNVAKVTAEAPFTCPGVVTDTDPSVVQVTSPQCRLQVVKTATPDTITAGPTPDCSTAGKPNTLVWKYTGADCSASANRQAADKWACSGVPGGPPVSISLIKDPNKLTISPTSGLQPGDLVTFSAIGSDMGAEVQLDVGAQFLKIHTSCSQPLAVGDVFGSLQLVEFNGQRATGHDVTYSYQVINGSAAGVSNIRVEDDKLGLIAQGFGLGPGESSQVFSKTVEVFETTTNTATATGELAVTGEVCRATDTATVTVEGAPVPFVCSDAKPLNQLSMIWNGSQSIRVTAYKGSIGSTSLGTVDNVAPGQVVTFTGFAGSPNDVEWEIFQAGTSTPIGKSTFHLSCSDANMNGPEDCGKVEGDGKGKTGYLNQWLLKGIVGQSGIGFACQ